jgi:glycosyltransferase involved in cell wall biosynthesis
MENVIVSVIIPSYNREILIQKAIDSVMKQTFQDFEILVIDDASTDNTKEIIDSLHNNKIKYFRLEKNSGQCVARNYGIRHAKGKYVAFLDSDDEWLPEKLEKQIDCFSKGSDSLGAVYGRAYQKDVIRDVTSVTTDEFYRGPVSDKFMDGFCPPTPSLFMVKTDVIKECNGFDEKLIPFVDLDMWLRISEKYEFDFVDEPIIIKYEQIGDQYINNFEKRYKGLDLFMKKWKGKISLAKGKKGLMKLRKHMVCTLVVPILVHPPANIRKSIFKLLGLVLSVRSTRMEFYYKSILILLFGPGIIYRIRKIIDTGK